VKRIFGPKREKVAGGCRRLHTEELHKLHASPDIVRVIESRRMTWAAHIARTGAIRNVYGVLIGDRKEETTPRPKCRW
jgi:hypothetical protein